MKSRITRVLKKFITIIIVVALVDGIVWTVYGDEEVAGQTGNPVRSQLLAAANPAGNIGEVWPEAEAALKTKPVLGIEDQATETIPELMPGIIRNNEKAYQSVEDKGLRLFVEESKVIISKEIPPGITIPIIFAASEPGTSIDVDEIKVMSGQKLLVEIRGKQVGGVSGSSITQELTVPLANLPVLKGRPIELVIKTKVSYKGQTVTLNVKTSVTIASLPSLKDWYCGDGHMHSNFYSAGSARSDDGLMSMADVVRVMKNRGYQWLVMTSHKGAIDTQTAWNNYWTACNNLQLSYAIPVCPGLEISTNGDAHALAYRQDHNKMPPHSQSWSESQLLAEITKQNPQLSFGGQAHPTGFYNWKSWPANSRLAELLSGEAVADNKNYRLWLKHLKRNLSGTLRTGQFCASVGNSDFHYGEPLGCTWLYSTSFAKNQCDPVWAALMAGKTSTSGRGNFGAIAANGYMQGSVLRNPSRLQFTVIQKPITGAHCEAFVIRDADGENVWQSSIHPDEITNVAIPLPSADTFYHACFIFNDDSSGKVKSDVITSPIFIDR